MFKKSLLLSLLLLAGCEQKFDEKKAASLVNEQIGTGCFYTTLTDPTDIRFNTLTRIYNKESKQITESPTRNFISLAKNPNYEKQHHQLTALESVGLVDKVESHVNTDGKGGFISDIQDAPSALTPTAKTHGFQYKLTNIGSGYIRPEANTNQLNICVGYLRVKHVQLPAVSKDKQPDMVTATYTIEVRDTPNWASDSTIAKEFPAIKKAITEKNGSTGQAIFVKTPKGYVIEALGN